ncbi:hypothetical protein T03_3258 [Trichinella britovi]|uniref:Uncharacterized protein n=1 Tax=Trichinella britovi TaxID=45882 RepID=A0A0V1CVX9_TRIBR|nr:hypothetical protein T03_3258 [Trichinella britovi]
MHLYYGRSANKSCAKVFFFFARLLHTKSFHNFQISVPVKVGCLRISILTWDKMECTFRLCNGSNKRKRCKCTIVACNRNAILFSCRHRSEKKIFNITSENHHLTADEQHNIGTFIYFLILSLARVKKKQKSKSRLGKINFVHMMKRMKVNFNAGLEANQFRLLDTHERAFCLPVDFVDIVAQIIYGNYTDRKKKTTKKPNMMI